MPDCRPCSSAHCSAVDPEINSVCSAMGWPRSHPVVTRDEAGVCCCSCSCLAHGTPVQAGDSSYKSIEDYEVGDSVLAAGLGLAWKPAPVAFSSGTTGASRQKYTVLITFRETFLAVTSDHLFVLDDRTLKRADKLTLRDKLIDPSGTPVEITSLHIGDYTAGFHHVATSKEPPNATLDGHLLNTNGIVSGDYALQLYARTGDLEKMAKVVGNDLPPIGSKEYIANHGSDCLRAPASLRGLSFSANNVVAGGLEPVFVSAEATRISVPNDACKFISDQEAAQRALDPSRPWNDPHSREWTEYLIQHHSVFYPSINFHFDWADDTVNAYAWVQNGQRHVAILGGLVRHMALELEGVALVLAHEIGHHYGGPPTFPGGLSCEGQADYYGVAVVMRRVWFGLQYATTADPAIAQMARFFGVPNSPTPPGGSAGCNHPPGRCRVAAYHAAVSLNGKPGCAA